MSFLVVCFFACAYCKFSLTDASRTYFSAYPFIRNLHDNGEVGSSSKRNGNAGILYEVMDSEELDYVLAGKLENLAKGRKFMIFLNGSFFNKATVTALSSFKSVTGIVVCDDPIHSVENPPPDYSPDFKTLQLGDFHSTDKDKYKWNPTGDDLFSQSFSFPITYVRESTQDYLIRAARYNKMSEYKSSKRLFSFDSQMYLYGKRNSQFCFDKDRCAPLVGTSTYGLFLGGEEFDNTKDFILVTAPLDARSEFNGLSQGAAWSSSPVAALLGALRGVRRFLDTSGLPEPSTAVMFGLFTGSNYGNFGAKRFVCHALNNESSYNIDNLQKIISLGEITYNTTELYVHSENDKESVDFQKAVVRLGTNLTEEFNGTVNIHRVSNSITPGIPPSPAGAFLEARNKKTGAEPVPTVHIATHNITYTNPFRGSRLDRYYNTAHVCNAARLTKMAILNALGYSDTEIEDAFDAATNDVNCSEIQEILTCLVDNSQCRLVTEEFRIDGVVADDVFALENSMYDIDNDYVPIHTALVSLMLQSIIVSSNATLKDCGSVSDCENKGERCSYAGKCVYTPIHFQDDYSTRLWFEYSEGGFFANPGYFYEDDTCENRLYHYQHPSPSTGSSSSSSSSSFSSYRKVKYAMGVTQPPPRTSNTSRQDATSSSFSSSLASSSTPSPSSSASFLSFLEADTASEAARKATPAARTMAKLLQPIRTRMLRRQRKSVQVAAHAQEHAEAQAAARKQERERRRGKGQAGVDANTSASASAAPIPTAITIPARVLAAAPDSYVAQNPMWMRSYADEITFRVYVTSPVYLDVLILLLGLAVNGAVIAGLVFLRAFFAKKLKVE